MTPLDRFGPLDAIDVALLAVLVYQGYALLVGSRAWNVVRGLVAVAGLWGVARAANLEGTAWLFERLAPVGLLALVIVFQPELRAALERVGRGRGRRAVDGDPVQELMTAIRELAAKRVGALVVLERTTPLGEFATRGVALETPVRAELLQTLFDSKGPLHDGAVLIRGDAIVAAGVILPLSQETQRFDRTLGTRHRAALGVSEVSDAWVVVVSEERGTVSVARDGHLETDVAPSDLLTSLRSVYGEVRP